MSRQCATATTCCSLAPSGPLRPHASKACWWRSSCKGACLLLGARGRPPVDIRALAHMLSRLSAFAHAAGPRLASIDLNPVFAMPEGHGAFAADAVIEVGE